MYSKMKRHHINVILLSVVLLVFVLGCSRANDQEKDYSNQMVEIFTTVGNEQSFYQNYGRIILESFPGIDIQITYYDGVSPLNADYFKSIQPDLLFLQELFYIELRDEGYLMPLNISGNDISIELDQYAEVMINALSDHSKVLHGLAPNMYAYPLYYNEDLFNQYHIELPLNGQSWDELFEIAMLFPDHTGLEYATTPTSLLYDIARTNELLIINAANEVVFGSEQWIEAFEYVVNLFRDENIGSEGASSFLKGQSAMYMGNLIDIQQLKNASFQWKVASMPTHPVYRERNHSVFFDQIIAIPIDSTNSELSKVILQEVMDEKHSQIFSRGMKFHSMSTHVDHMNSYQEVDISTLWLQTESRNHSKEGMLEPRKEELKYQILDRYLAQAIEGQLSNEESIAMIIAELEALIASP